MAEAKECDNIAACHEPRVITEDMNAARVICINCKRVYILRKDWRGVYENRAYSKIYKKDVLQGKDNLLYKYHPEYLNM